MKNEENKKNHLRSQRMFQNKSKNGEAKLFMIRHVFNNWSKIFSKAIKQFTDGQITPVEVLYIIPGQATYQFFTKCWPKRQKRICSDVDADLKSIL